MGANIAGIYGAQIFRRDDRPNYRRAFSIGIGVLAFGVALATVRYLDDVVRRRRHRRRGTLAETGATITENTDEKNRRESLIPPSDEQPAPIVFDSGNGAVPNKLA